MISTTHPPNHSSPSVPRFIFLKAYHCPDGRIIHYSAGRLRKDPASPNGTAILDLEEPTQNSVNTDNDDDNNNNNNNNNNSSGSKSKSPCWIFFYPAGPNRRLLAAILHRYAPHFDCEKDVTFLCVNRPGKGTSSPSSSQRNHSQTSEGSKGDSTNIQAQKTLTASTAIPSKESILSPEREHIHQTCLDVVTILNHYRIPKVSIMYMCAGSTFAFSFAKEFRERCVGNIIGISSWILRSSKTNAGVVEGSNVETNGSQDSGDGGFDTTNLNNVIDDRFTNPHSNCSIHSPIHRLAMNGYFGPMWMVSSLAGGIVGSATGALGFLPKKWLENKFRKDMSPHEQMEFDALEKEGVNLVDVMNWIHEDGDAGKDSIFVNTLPQSPNSSMNCDLNSNGCNAVSVGVGCTPMGGGGAMNNKDGDAKDILICLSTQQFLQMEYGRDVPPQKYVLLWHGDNDRMISVLGSEWLVAVLSAGMSARVNGGKSKVKLHRVGMGTHQGTMFFFPRGVMEALNCLSMGKDLKLE